ncbi:hypothetical protein ZOSMA_450G00020 [Zostera marina]|uniref:J domain-containing protein n=1 Tax=Zostera marina TaxID=29655 RepID=A0A0K9P300_ZOSMR|nr:hypothetical protein ZOSMA_450G00020 [Zostera marina]
MDGGGGGGEGRQGATADPAEAQRWYEIAAKLLEVQDLIGCKRFAERAMDADPLFDGVDQIIAAADVLLASQRRINNHVDWYAILQLETSLSSEECPDTPVVKRAYRRLALLLHPRSNLHPSATNAFKLVNEAWGFLSDPAKKKLYDDEIKIAAHLASNGQDKSTAIDQSSPDPPSTFWTMCSSCFRAYEYGNEYKGKFLLCQNCQKSFQAEELTNVPPSVPGTDLYYCSWGLFPLGFPGVPSFNGVVIPEGTICIPAHPSQHPPPGGGGGGGRRDSFGGTKIVSNGNATQINTRQKSTPPVGRRPRKVLAKKPKKKDSVPPARVLSQSAILFGEEMDQEISESPAPAQAPPQHHRQQQQQHHQHQQQQQNVHNNAGDYGGRFDMNSFGIDLDHTAEVLGNLENLPFLNGDDIIIMH